jgi:type 1 glutamine amidotransferase
MPDKRICQLNLLMYKSLSNAIHEASDKLFFTRLNSRKIYCQWLILLFALTANSIGSHANQNNDPSPKPRIVFLISQDSLNYEAHKTIPVFAEQLRKLNRYEVTVILGEGSNNAFHFPGLEVIQQAGVVVLFSRRIALPTHQLQMFKNYLSKGGSLVAIRTGNHAFTTHGDKVEGYVDWPEFVSDILGCGNYGYGPVEPGTDVSVAPQAIGHPILKDFRPTPFHSVGNLYRVTPLTDANTVILLNGTNGKETQPVAWIRNAGLSRVFYTTLGYPSDFSSNQFKGLLINAIHWAASKKL